MRKHLSCLLSLLLVLVMLTTTAGAVTVQIRYQPCDFTFSGNEGSYVRLSLSSGRPRNDLSVLSAYDASGSSLKNVTRTTAYTPADGAYMSDIVIRTNGTSSDSAEFTPCTASLVNGYGLNIQESGSTATLHIGDAVASALTEGCNALLYRRTFENDFEFCVLLYFDDSATGNFTGSTNTTPGGSGTTPGNSGTTPGSSNTTPGSTNTTPGSTETNPGSTSTPGASTGGKLVTGSVDLPQLSKQEIIDLLAENSTTPPTPLFDIQPSCTAPYQTGRLSAAALQAALNRLNALRRIAGMPATNLDQSWCDAAQYGAVILGALGNLSHTPSQPSGMDKAFYDKAYTATNSSNLSAGRAFIASIDGLMLDSSGSNLTSAGHRRWQMSPALTKVGFGHVDNGSGYVRFTDVKVFDRNAGFSSANSVNYDSFGWPSAGYFPNDTGAFTNVAPWTVELNPDVYAVPSGVTVRISGGGRSWTLSGSYNTSESGAYLTTIPGSPWNYGGSHCIIFRPDGVTKYEGTYTVEIQGLKYKNNTPAPFSYSVEFFSTAQPDSSSTASTPGGSQTQTTPEKPETPATPEKPQNPSTPSTPGTSGARNPFTDVPASAYYTDAVLWAYNNGVTSGTTATTFEPYATCTRGQVVTFLWRAMGEPEPATRTNPFRDVKSSDYYYKAVLWAAETGITTGTSTTAFSPNDTCTNGHVVTFLWRAEGKPAASGTSALASSFASDFYTDAVAWADTTGLLNDTGAAFNPASQSPRANIVTYLYRDLAE